MSSPASRMFCAGAGRAPCVSICVAARARRPPGGSPPRRRPAPPRRSRSGSPRRRSTPSSLGRAGARLADDVQLAPGGAGADRDTRPSPSTGTAARRRAARCPARARGRARRRSRRARTRAGGRGEDAGLGLLDRDQRLRHRDTFFRGPSAPRLGPTGPRDKRRRCSTGPPRRRRARPVADAPVDALLQRVEDLAEGLAAGAARAGRALAGAATILAAELARDGPRMCEAVVRALADDGDLRRLEPGGRSSRSRLVVASLPGLGTGRRPRPPSMHWPP